jgi:hypothetical protein
VRFYRSDARKLREWEITVNGAMALAAVLGCTGILVHSFVDFNLQNPANAALLCSGNPGRHQAHARIRPAQKIQLSPH